MAWKPPSFFFAAPNAQAAQGLKGTQWTGTFASPISPPE
ncbi:hypothetical protein C4K35_3687 [Pseudomonas chlororaphis subsp. piscium]|nr:hypothetical protein C4K35_3687 [Pseudomonas chlororaphis subsp. piscium]AZC57841.1 hypothetical protein C4K34_3678 [Pseudomonas chlororaphis subsp. piscium]